MHWLRAPGAAGLAIMTIGPLSDEAMAAITAADGRVERALDWDAIDDPALDGAAQPLVIATIPPDVGHGPLERLATLLDAADLHAVVAFEAAALDVVAAVLMGPRITLLCDAGPGDWATALAFAALRAEALPAGVHEGGDAGERLRRLNAEVARIARALAELVEPEDEVAERRRRYAGEPPTEILIDAADIRAVIRARRLRASFFDARLLEDPGWDMLLDLFAAELEGGRVSVSSLCIASAVAPTTALRWISRMVDAGLMVRLSDPGDRRRAFLKLDPSASAAMRAYVAAARRTGLPIA